MGINKKGSGRGQFHDLVHEGTDEMVENPSVSIFRL
jgi:hypothetical protein